MSLSASRIRSLSSRTRSAEEAVYPGLRNPRPGFPYNLKSPLPSQFRGDAMQKAFSRAGLA